MSGANTTKIWLPLLLHRGQFLLSSDLKHHRVLLKQSRFGQNSCVSTIYHLRQVITQQNCFAVCFRTRKQPKHFCVATPRLLLSLKKLYIAPHYLETTLHDMSRFYSVMDESNDKTDKSCIILVRILDPIVGDIRTRFFDMPIVNIGTAQTLFDALKLSLTNKGLDFSKCISFMSDTTNVMKGARSGVQKLIKAECSDVLDVGCICHLADLRSRLVCRHFLLTSISSLLMYFTTSITVVKENRNFATFGAPSLPLNRRRY